MLGWICARCGASVAPSIQICPSVGCGGQQYHGFPTYPPTIVYPNCVHEFPSHLYIPPGGSVACMKCGMVMPVYGQPVWGTTCQVSPCQFMG